MRYDARSLPLPLCLFLHVPRLVVGQMIALRLETVLIGNVVQRIGLSIGRHPADGTAHAERLLLGAGVLQLGLLLARDAVAGLVARVEWSEYNYRVSRTAFSLPKVVAIDADVVVVVAQNCCLLRIVQRRCQQLRGAEQSAQCEDSNVDGLHYYYPECVDLYTNIYIYLFGM